MLLYRIARLKYARDLSGEGARRVGGRWNPKGTSVIYTSDSTALATLEAIVHMPLNLLPGDMSIICFEFPDDLEFDSVSSSMLPEKWFTYPPPPELAGIGTDWINKNKSVALKVPSSVTPKGEGKNFLLNPRHPDFKKIKIVDVSPYEFDSRLKNKKS